MSKKSSQLPTQSASAEHLPHIPLGFAKMNLFEIIFSGLFALCKAPCSYSPFLQ